MKKNNPAALKFSAELLIQIANALPEDGLISRLLQRMNYIREFLSRTHVQPFDEFKQFLDSVVLTISCDDNHAWKLRDNGATYNVQKHKTGRRLDWDYNTVGTGTELVFFRDLLECHKKIDGNWVLGALKDRGCSNSILLKELLAHPEFVPKSWDGCKVFFLGTIYERTTWTYSKDTVVLIVLCWEKGQLKEEEINSSCWSDPKNCAVVLTA